MGPSCTSHPTAASAPGLSLGCTSALYPHPCPAPSPAAPDRCPGTDPARSPHTGTVDGACWQLPPCSDALGWPLVPCSSLAPPCLAPQGCSCWQRAVWITKHVKSSLEVYKSSLDNYFWPTLVDVTMLAPGIKTDRTTVTFFPQASFTSLSLKVITLPGLFVVFHLIKVLPEMQAQIILFFFFFVWLSSVTH